MRILINATSARLGGGITVLRNLLPALLRGDHGAHDYLVVGHRDLLKVRDDRLALEATAEDSGSLASRMVREQVGIPVSVLRNRVDLVFSPGGLAVFGAAAPQVLMYQNMAPFEPRVVARTPAPERRRFFALRKLGLLSARIARRLVFISRFAQRSMIPLIGGRALDSTCVPLGRDEAFRPEHRRDSSALPEALGLPERYLLSVSQLYFYKNFVELVSAFARARSGIPSDVVLVIAGAEPEPEYARQVRSCIARHGLEGRVKLIGSVPYEHLPALYAGALAFFFPSTVESFPNILVEALGSGAPTFSSKLGPMPEIAGDAATYFDPYDVDDIARALVRACNDEALRTTLAARGPRRVERFSWDTTARALLDVFEEVGP